MTKTVVLTLFVAIASTALVILAHVEANQRPQFDWVWTGRR